MLSRREACFPVYALLLSPFSYIGRCALKSGILFYRLLLSPLFGPTCRFYPSCSAYALEAVEKYGPCKGAYLTVMRLAKCHPFHVGGFDPLR